MWSKSTLNNTCSLCVRLTTMPFSFDYTFSLQNCTQQYILFTAAFSAYHKLGDTPCTLRAPTPSQHSLRPRHLTVLTPSLIAPPPQSPQPPYHHLSSIYSEKGLQIRLIVQPRTLSNNLTIIIYHFLGSSTVTEQYKYFY